MLATQWTRNFIVTDADVEYLTGLMLERETPMTSGDLALTLIEQRLKAEKDAIEARYRGTEIYNPAHTYAVGDRLVFSKMDNATATIQETRVGDNPEHGEFLVITVEFDERGNNPSQHMREFAAALQTPHPLSQNNDEFPTTSNGDFSPQQILDKGQNYILNALTQALVKNKSLTRVAGYWFTQDLVLDIDIGLLHLAEAVLDMASGGPLSTADIIDQMGGTGKKAPQQLEIFSMNLAMSKDDRFAEVGPAGEVLWYLKRMMPASVQQTPELLHYRPIPYDEDLLTEDMIELETELDDEFTDIEFEGNLRRATTILLYAHRRAGTLPLNAKTQMIFPSGRTPRIHVSLIDATDNEVCTGWVVHEDRYVFGLADYYAKHRLPVGALISVEKGEQPGQIILSYDGYKPRTEYIKVIMPNTDHLQIENKKRAIGASYDELFVFGVDELAALDTLVKVNHRQSIAALLRMLIVELGKLSPQGTVHAVSLYSLINVFRRCPPGLVFATLQANPDFEDVGDHYWKMRE
jgi:hypothetical protein